MSVIPAGEPLFHPKQRAFGPHSASVRRAREFVLNVLAEWGVEDRLEDVRCCVSELTTNALVHGTSAAGFAVRLSVRDDLMRIEVVDDSSELPQADAPDWDSDGGRGLLLVASFADAWGVEVHPRHGKTVWTEFKIAEARRLPAEAVL
jgi:anti-sigma regulatory factor (Ser/Thr protein kinase)